MFFFLIISNIRLVSCVYLAMWKKIFNNTPALQLTLLDEKHVCNYLKSVRDHNCAMMSNIQVLFFS